MHAQTLAHAATAEHRRLLESHVRADNWHRWGPYLSERQWGTVREDYSPDGDCWNYFPHDHAAARAYRWGEDGLLGLCDRQCRLCFSLALWNGRDPILKERLFGLTGPQGNHGEDVKECYYYLDATPTYSYLKALYKYPQAEFPYSRLVDENRRRDRLAPEFELADTGVFDGGRYFDVLLEYAKESPNDIFIRITVNNRGPEAATLHLLPTLWFRNTWSWGCTHEGCEVKPRIDGDGAGGAIARHATLGTLRLVPEAAGVPLLFTESETNKAALWGVANESPFAKDAFHAFVIRGDRAAVNPNPRGTKAAWHYVLNIPAGGQQVVRLRLFEDGESEIHHGGTEARREETGEQNALFAECDQVLDQLPSPCLRDSVVKKLFAQCDRVFEQRQTEADEFYATLSAAAKHEGNAADDAALVERQAYAGLLWSKQFYHLVVKNWLEGDPDQPPPPAARRHGRNHDWPHLFNRDVISMPDKWEYPWYAAWDLAFHMLPMARVDGEFAKSQLALFLREWYMHPNGQIPAYEFAFSDVNPPVHGWACWRVYKMTGPRGHRDRHFLASVFTKLLLNFTWWVNRKDIHGNHLFAGGFLGLDNIGVFDRSRPLPTGGHLDQADGTAWMAFYCGTMLAMALELAQYDSVYEDIASKFFEHFVHIADAMNTLGGCGLWDEQDGFYYDQIRSHGNSIPLRIRSMVGIIPLFANIVLDDDVIARLPGFRKRMNWFLNNRADLARQISYMQTTHDGRDLGHRLLAIPSRERLLRVLRYVLDESEFLSPFGVRSLSKRHQSQPYVFRANGDEMRVEYVPGESNSGLFGGNSNWRGPIWFPVNFLLIEALERYHHFYGDTLTVECPTGSGRWLNLKQVACELSRRLTRLFLRDAQGHRPCHGGDVRYAADPHWRDLLLFYEYFHGDTGRGLGASHQTGWTSLVALLLQDLTHVS